MSTFPPTPCPEYPISALGRARFHPTGPQALMWGKPIFLPGGIWGLGLKAAGEVVSQPRSPRSRPFSREPSCRELLGLGPVEELQTEAAPPCAFTYAWGPRAPVPVWRISRPAGAGGDVAVRSPGWEGGAQGLAHV